MYGMLLAAGVSALGTGMRMAQRSSEQRRAANEKKRSYADFANQYGVGQQQGQQAAEDAAMHQQMAMARSGGTPASQAAAVRAAQQNAPASAATATLAGHQIGGDYAQGARGYRGTEAAVGGDYADRTRGGDERLMNQLAGGLAPIAQGLNTLGSSQQGNFWDSPTVTPESQQMTAPAMPVQQGPAPMGYAGPTYAMSPSAAVDPSEMDDSEFYSPDVPW